MKYNFTSSMRNSLSQMQQIGIFVLMLIWLIAEYLFSEMIKQGDIAPRLSFANIFAWAIMCISFFAILYRFVVMKKDISTFVLRKLLNNAIGYKWLSVVFVIVFALELAWLSDVTYNIMIKDYLGTNGWEEPVKVGLILYTMIVITALFPVGRIGEDDTMFLKERSLLLTAVSLAQGGSLLNANNIELLLKPFHDKNRNDDQLSMSISKVLLILSKDISKCKIADDVKENAKDKEAMEKAAKEFDEADPKEKDDKLKLVLSVALRDLPNMENHNVKFIVHKPVSYDSFEDVYREANTLLFLHEHDTKNTVVHISPGTAIPTGALTAVAIKGQRLMLYTEQTGRKIQTVNIDAFTIKDLLSDLWAEIENKY